MMRSFLALDCKIKFRKSCNRSAKPKHFLPAACQGVVGVQAHKKIIMAIYFQN